MPPGAAKSILISILWPCWLSAIKPQLKIICGSYAQKISRDDLSFKAKAVIEERKRFIHINASGSCKVHLNFNSLAVLVIRDKATTKNHLRIIRSKNFKRRSFLQG